MLEVTKILTLRLFWPELWVDRVSEGQHIVCLPALNCLSCISATSWLLDNSCLSQHIQSTAALLWYDLPKSPEAQPLQHTWNWEGAAVILLLLMSSCRARSDKSWERGFLLCKAKYFHFLHHIYLNCDVKRISRVLKLLSLAVFLPCFSVFKGLCSKLNGNTELLLLLGRVRAAAASLMQKNTDSNHEA